MKSVKDAPKPRFALSRWHQSRFDILMRRYEIAATGPATDAGMERFYKAERALVRFMLRHLDRVCFQEV